MDYIPKWIILVWSALAAFVVSLPVAIQALAILQIIDLASGLIVAGQNRSLSSRIASLGFRKKAMEWIAVLVVAVLGLGLQEVFSVTINGAGPVSAVAIYLATVEAISILENANGAGVTMPKWIMQKLESVSKQYGEEETNNGG